ncbi:hypothetical protein [Chelativorans sp. AA-79]|uniref:hypothetical protein n=1 Tax=Chelativorans sp. AA-79 TaxID=3028735 RepID=UPI0023F6AC3E|nr:hypothetical protein [Chelativorans sp. AA-79]WEX09998.1 hypothetical protein PVE73_03250 [Chelativorans sp. AA-79]
MRSFPNAAFANVSLPVGIAAPAAMPALAQEITDQKLTIEGGDGSAIARSTAESAHRAIMACAPYNNLPAERYSSRHTIVLTSKPTF